LSLAVATLRRAGFGGQVGRLLLWPSESPHGVVLATDRRVRGEPAGVACCASFGATGWIGALGVVPSARGRGLGAALTEACVQWLRARGAQTVLLYATEPGRPVYERLGFEAEGLAIAWQGRSPQPEGSGLRALRDDDRPAMAQLDREMAGEDRGAVLEVLGPARGIAAIDPTDGTLSGFATASPWGISVAVCARDTGAGLALMAGVCAQGRGGTLIVPEDNAAAAQAVRRWGLTRANDGERMRLGPAPAWDVRRQFGLFNLFWG